MPIGRPAAASQRRSLSTESSPVIICGEYCVVPSTWTGHLKGAGHMLHRSNTKRNQIERHARPRRRRASATSPLRIAIGAAICKTAHFVVLVLMPWCDWPVTMESGACYMEKAEQAQQHPGTRTTINPAEDSRKKQCRPNETKPNSQREAPVFRGYRRQRHSNPTHIATPQAALSQRAHTSHVHRD